jgi:allophanate hydrolase
MSGVKLGVKRAGPASTIQDAGRVGYLGFGLSRGGAADQLALAEGAALLRQSPDLAVIEMTGMGGDFVARGGDVRIALTGAQMRASIDGTAIAWNGSHLLPDGAVLTIGPARHGVYGYLHVGGGINAPSRLSARSVHLAAGLGDVLTDGTELPIGVDPRDEVNDILPTTERFDGGEIRLLPSLQTGLFGSDVLARFEDTEFTRDMRGNRMGVRMDSDGAGFAATGGLTVLSEVIVPGDIQVTGDGAPFVLLTECQTTGGYPRIGTVLPCDLSRVAQAQPGVKLRFRFVTLDDATDVEIRANAMVASLRDRVTPRVRDPRDMADLLSYQLISGMVAGNEEDMK